MKCSVCGYELRPLFISMACDRCDGLLKEELPQGDTYPGWICLRHHSGAGREEYVFQTQEHASVWRAVAAIVSGEIREVALTSEPRWVPSRGRVSGVMLADRLYTIFYDRAAFLAAPEGGRVHAGYLKP